MWPSRVDFAGVPADVWVPLSYFGPAQIGRARNLGFLAVIARMKPELRRMVGRWTGEYQYTIDRVLDDIVKRCRELGLRLARSPRRSMMDVVTMVTVQTMNYLHAGHHRVAL